MAARRNTSVARGSSGSPTSKPTFAVQLPGLVHEQRCPTPAVPGLDPVVARRPTGTVCPLAGSVAKKGPWVRRRPMFGGMEPVPLGWLAAGCVAYLVGAFVFVKEWPDPHPEVFGFHEVWHLFVLAGAAAHYGFMLTLLDEVPAGF